MRRIVFLSLAMLCCASLWAQMGQRFPSERKVIKDPKTGVELVFLTSKSGTGDSKIYQTHNQWTSDGKWVIFRYKITIINTIYTCRTDKYKCLWCTYFL